MWLIDKNRAVGLTSDVENNDGKIVDKYVRKESVKLSDFKNLILTYRKLNNN